MDDAIVLIDGPRTGEWYWARDWIIRTDAAKAMGWTSTDVPGWALGYRLASGHPPVDHPRTDGLVGRPYVWAVA